MKNNQIVLSICIPSFNRGYILDKMILETLNKCDSKSFEILVVDNCSDDDTLTRLKKINDDRLRIIANHTPIPGPHNIINALYKSEAIFSVLCLDKDNIMGEKLDDFIDFLIGLSDQYVFGYTPLIDQVKSTRYYNNTVDSLINCSYQSNHPTGMFYRNSCLKQITLEYNLDTKGKFGFYPDVLNAEMTRFGNACVPGIQTFKMETRKNCEKIKSFTFQKNLDLFFLPHARTKACNIYLNHLSKQNLSDRDKTLVMNNINYRSLEFIAVVYPATMKNESIVTHYHLKPKNISFFKILFHTINFYVNILFKNTSLNTTDLIQSLACASKRIIVTKYKSIVN